MSSIEYNGVVAVVLRRFGSIGVAPKLMPSPAQLAQAMFHAHLPDSAQNAS